jgi:hypothetical protein
MQYTIGPGEKNEYTIFFYNCKPESKVSFELDIELYNSYKGKRNYLSGPCPVSSGDPPSFRPSCLPGSVVPSNPSCPLPAASHTPASALLSRPAAVSVVLSDRNCGGACAVRVRASLSACSCSG